MEGFEEFDQYHSRSVKSLFVTIQRRGNFSLNRATFKALGQPSAVKLLFNRSKRQIGFRPANSNDFRSIPVRKQGISDSYMLAGLTFCKEYDIDTSTARRYEGKVEEGMLIIDLNGPSVDATGPRLRNDVSEELQGKQERRLARRIAERTLTSDDEIRVEANSALQNSQKTTNQGTKGMLSQQDRIALENALKKGEVSTVHDILNFLENGNNTQL
ncbi:MAG TPA: hypothetical protein VGL94_04640 [Ktedonobacteraceae bacterium]|jgi:hypothetical protein